MKKEANHQVHFKNKTQPTISLTFKNFLDHSRFLKVEHWTNWAMALRHCHVVGVQPWNNSFDFFNDFQLSS